MRSPELNFFSFLTNMVFIPLLYSARCYRTWYDRRVGVTRAPDGACVDHGQRARKDSFPNLCYVKKQLRTPVIENTNKAAKDATAIAEAWSDPEIYRKITEYLNKTIGNRT